LERRGRERRQLETGGGDDWLEVPDFASAPEGEVETQELGNLLARELAALRPDQREIVVLRDVQGLSYEEIAEVLGCSVSAVKSKLFRARSVLRTRLGKYMGWEA
jgi:RNA polymerase sigma-70 factor (ECF subfamily)